MKSKIIAYTVGPFGAAFLGIVTLPIITWFYSIEDIGRISMLQICIGFYVLLFSFGLDQTYIREYHDSNNKKLLLKTVLWPSMLVGFFILMAIIILDFNLISKIVYGIPSFYLSLLTAICLLASLISRFLSLILRMQERAFAFSMSQLLSKIFFLIFILSIVLFDYTKSINTLLIANTIAIVLALLIYLWNVRSDFLEAIKLRYDFKKLSSALAYGLPLVIAGIASWMINVMDRLFLRQFSSYTELGFYSVAFSIAAIATLISSVFNLIWAPLVFRWMSEGNLDYKKIDNIFDYLLIIIYFFIVIFGVLSWIIPFFLPLEYTQINYLIAVCILGPLFYTLSEVSGIGIAIAKKTNLVMLCSIIIMIISAALNYMLIPIYGASGAAISTALAFFLFLVLKTEFSKMVWRKKSYFQSFLILFLLMLITFVNLILEEFRGFIYYFWLFMFFIGVYVFFGRIKEFWFFVLKKKDMS